MQRSMDREVASNRLPDVTVSMPPLPLTAAEVAAPGRLANVTVVGPRSLFATRVWVGERRERAIVVGVPDYGAQRADVVFVDSGDTPTAGTVPTDQGNRTRKGFKTGEDGKARLLGADGAVSSLTVFGVGRNLTNGEDDPGND